MPRETMTARERWLAAIVRHEPDRVPMDYWGTPEATDALCRHLGVDFEAACERLHLDVPVTVTPRYVGPPLASDTTEFGVLKRPVNYGAGVYLETAHSPLAAYASVEEIEAHYQWPSADWWDYSLLPEQIRGCERRIIRGGGSEPFLTYKELRGEQQAFLDLLMHPEIVHYCLDKLFDLAYENTRRIFETIPGAVSITYVAEDLGGQESLMMSLDHIREFLLPRMKRMMGLAREHGSHVFVHSDGAVRDVIPDLIEIGMEVLNPIQWRCRGMEREGLKRDFGHRVAFHGGVDNQYTLPFGSVDEVRREVVDNLRILAAGGGYVLCPCHNIQPITPPENVVAMYETGYAEGWR